MEFVEFKNVTKRYNDKLAVDNISLEIGKGEIFGFLGPNGAGKSTSISMLCGLVKNDGGDILIGGYSINNESIKAKGKIGLVPQDIALYENLSALDNLKFWGSMYGLRGTVLKERMDEVLEACGLKERAKDKISSYSGGMKRRINIACAVMHRPEIVIMDEPTVGIDPQSRNHILEFTKMLNEKYKTTVIYTSHYMEEVETICSKLAIMDGGKIIAKGTKEEIKRMVTNEEKLEIKVEGYKEELTLQIKKLPKVREAYYIANKLTVVISEAQASLQNIMVMLINSGARIQDISINSPNLETVFLSLTGKSLRD